MAELDHVARERLTRVTHTTHACRSESSSTVAHIGSYVLISEREREICAVLILRESGLYRFTN